MKSFLKSPQHGRKITFKSLGFRRIGLGCLFWLALLAPLYAQQGTGKPVTVRIVAFNDFHGNLRSPGNMRANAQSPEVPVGGAEVLAGYVEALAAENPVHVVVAGGDLIGASPLVSALFHNEDSIEVLNRMGLEVTSVGNHEFDKGVAELLRMQNGGCAKDQTKSDQGTCKGQETGTPVPFEGAKFQYLAANVFDQRTGKTILPAYAIKTYGGVLVAFIGLPLEGTPSLVDPAGVAGLRFAEESKTINDVVHELRKQGVQTFVVLIHQGGKQTTRGPVDINGCEGGLDGSPIQEIVSKLDDAVALVVSAHTHAAYVCQLPNSTGRKISVSSASSFGRVVTSIDLTLDPATKKAVSATARNLLVDRTNRAIRPDRVIAGIVDRYELLAAPVTNRVVGTITADFSTAHGESAIGDLIADAQLEATHDAGAVVAFMNEGGIRGPLLYASTAPGAGEGKVTYGELFTIQPFGNHLVTMTLRGAQLKTVLEEQFKGCAAGFPAAEKNGQPEEEQMQVSKGFTYSWNPAGKVCEKVDAASIKIDGTAVVPDGKYRITVNNYLADGGSHMYEFTRGTDIVSGELDLDALQAYFGKHHELSPVKEKRIQETVGNK